MLDIVKSVKVGAVIMVAVYVVSSLVNTALEIVRNGITNDQAMTVYFGLAVVAVLSIAQYFLEKSENK